MRCRDLLTLSLLGPALAASCGAPDGPGPFVADDLDAATVADLSPGTRAKTTANLNLRSGPGREFRVLLVMPSDSTVEVVDRRDAWYSVTFERTTGWASGAYLSALTEPEPKPEPEPEENAVWTPRPGTSWQWQLSGPVDLSLDVQMYDVDLFEAPDRTLADLHTAGRIAICYFSAGSFEPGRPDSDAFPAQAIGRVMDGWPDERWLDIRDTEVRRIMTGRMDTAKSKGCDGVEPDNVDGFANATGFPLTARDQLDYNRFLAAEAHARGLSIGLKNDLDQIEALAADFDWALNEECFAYDECDQLAPFIDAGKAVFQVEYGGTALARRVCPDANARGFDTLIKNLDLDAFRIACR